MVGVPSILIGIFVFTILVLPFKQYNAFAGSVALAVIMVPVIMRTTEEILQIVPGTLREARCRSACPSGGPCSRSSSATGAAGILTGLMLAVARAAGETAPLLFTALGSRLVNVGDFAAPMDALPLFIYNNARQPYEALNEQAWGAAFLLLLFVLTVNIAGRAARWADGPDEGDIRDDRRHSAPRPRQADARPSTRRRPARRGAAVGRSRPAAHRPSSSLNVYYGAFRAVRDVSMTIRPHAVTAIIGPSGCGKSTFLRSLNRMHELIPGARVEGQVLLDGTDLYDPAIDPVQLRRNVGMVFQRPNPFPTMSIYDNVVAGLRLPAASRKAELDEIVERSPAPRRAVGRGQGQARADRHVAVGRPAAAAVHRPGARRRPRGHPHGRAVLGARSRSRRCASRS